MQEVKVLKEEDLEVAINTLLLAFSGDPLQRYFMPHPTIYFQNSAIWFENAARQSIETNTLFGTKDFSGLAVWFKPNYEVQFESLETTMNDLPFNSKDYIFQYFEEFEKSKPKDAWYLEYLGVDPSMQSLGIGSLLLEYVLSEIDIHHEPAYLESSNPRNMTLYKRHGFETLKKFQFGDGPPIHTMYREAR